MRYTLTMFLCGVLLGAGFTATISSAHATDTDTARMVRALDRIANAVERLEQSK